MKTSGEAMKSIGRNDVCWCGSKKKYKKCHLGREKQERPNPWDVRAKNKKAFSQKACGAKGVGLGDCEGRIINAHTVSRGANLKKIASDGKVIHYAIDYKGVGFPRQKLTAQSIGIRNASTFCGFCAKHDRELFSCIENEQFTGRPDQCLTATYRTLSRERYGKNAIIQMEETLRDADKGRPLSFQLSYQSIRKEFELSSQAGNRDLINSHDRITDALACKQYDALTSLVLEFDGVLPFMVSGAWAPFTDLYGREIQKGYIDEILEVISISSFVTSACSYICISWLDIAEAPALIIADQIQSEPSQQQAAMCLQMCLKHVENIFFSPKWFDGLSEGVQKQLFKLAISGVDQMGSIPTEEILRDANFDLPRSLRSFIVGRSAK